MHEAPPALHALESLEQTMRTSAGVRRFFYHCSRVFPTVVTILLAFLVLYPILFLSAGDLLATLASLVGIALSFASLCFTAARASVEHRVHALRLVASGSILFRSALAMSVALAMATTRERLALAHPVFEVLDTPLRVAAAIVTVAGIGMIFHGFRTLVFLFGPELEEEATQRLRAQLTPETQVADSRRFS